MNAQASSSGGILVPILVLAGIIGVVLLMIWLSHKRRAAVRDLLAAKGFNVNIKNASREEAYEYTSLVDGNPLLRDTRAKFTLRATGHHDGLQITAAQYYYMTGSGKQQQTHYNTIVATPLEVDLPPFTIERRRLLSLAEKNAVKIPLELPGLEKAVRIYAHQPEGVLVMLSPAIQQRMLAWPRSYWLHFDGRRLMIAARAAESVKVLTPLLSELSALMRELPVEVREAAGVSNR